MMEYTVNPIVTRGFSYGNLVVTRGLGYIWLKVFREVLRFISPLVKMHQGSSGVTRTIFKNTFLKKIEVLNSRLGKCE